MPRVLRFAVPAGLVCALATFAAYAVARANPASDIVADRSAATLTLFLVAFWVLVLVARPYRGWRLALLAAMAASFAAVALLPAPRRIAALAFDPRETLVATGIALIGAAVLTVVPRLTRA